MRRITRDFDVWSKRVNELESDWQQPRSLGIETMRGNEAALLRTRGNVSHYASTYGTRHARSDLIIELYNLFSVPR
jgi:hypothetical protein